MTITSSSSSGPQEGQTEVNRPFGMATLQRIRWLPGLALILLVFIAYQPVWRVGFIWDDNYYVTDNPVLRSTRGLERIWFEPSSTVQYYPLVFTSFWTEYHLWKLQPLGYHLINVLLHALNAILLWFVLRQLKVPGSWVAAAIFALHPVCVESVAWVTERKNVLSGLFYFLTILVYLRFRPLTTGSEARPWDWRYYPLVCALFLCALFSKTVTASLPAALALLIWWKLGRVSKEDAVALAPLFAAGAAFGFMTAWIEKHHVGARGAEWVLSPAQRCLLAGRALWFYAGKVFWPRNLTFIYPRWEIDARKIWQYLFPIAAMLALAALWLLRSRIGRGPLVAALFFAGTLLPALGFVDIFPFRYSYVADHFQYLASIGLIGLAVGIGATVCRRAGEGLPRLGAISVAVVLLLLGASTWKRAKVYWNLETLWEDTITRNPNAYMAYTNLGDALLQKNKIPEAIERYKQAQRLEPNEPDALASLGNAYLHLDKVPEAIGYFRQAIQLKPSFGPAYTGLGLALEREGKIPEAIAQYEQAVRTDPHDAQAHSRLGLLVGGTGNATEAMRHYHQALLITPDDPQIHSNLATLLEQIGRTVEAIQQYELAIQLSPDLAQAHKNLGIAFLRTGRVQEALAELQRGVQLAPEDADGHNNLAIALAVSGRTQEAMTQWEQAIRLRPSDAKAQLNLAIALEKTGRVSEAVEHYQEALKAQPDLTAARDALVRLRLDQGQ
ncbi:MAG TPA: tetratricopeptide repeat protein [Verrucomicrobiae bacterium]|nr:tetratricopeptide repeat protein [Verrucomicrobiae bacterium]